MKKKMILNTFTPLFAQLVNVVFGFVMPRLILEHFGSEVNGLTQSIKQFLGIITFLDMGVGQVVRSALYRPLSYGDDGQISRVMASGRRFYRQLAAILLGYVVVLILLYPSITASSFGWWDTAALIAAMAVSSFAQYFFGIINEQLLHADQRGYVIHSLQIICNVLNVALCVLFINMGASIQVVKLVASVVLLIRPVFIWLYVRKKYCIDPSVRSEKEPIEQKWHGVAQHISAVVLDGTDTIVLTFLSTLANVSVYSVYYMVISSLQTFYQSATAGIQSAAGALWARNDRQAQERMFAATEPALHFVTVFVFSCTGVLLLPFVQVYTAGLTDADYHQPLFAGLLVLAYAIRCLRTPYNIWILAAGHYKQTQVCHITAAGMNLLISILAVNRLGLVGVAIGTLCAMIYQTGWMAFYNVRHLLKRPLGTVIRQFAVDLAAAGVTILCCSAYSLGECSYYGWLILAVKTGCTALAVSASIWFAFYRKPILAVLSRNK